MNLISTLVIILLVLPIHGIITDISSGKIKNYFIFPSLFFCFLLGAFIDGFYSTQSNLIGIGICIAIGFLFYRQHSWGAGDGKYIILLGICSTLITYLKSLPYMIISLLFASIFGIFILYNLYYLIQKLPSIRKISFPKYTIHWLYLMMTTSGIFIVSSGLNLVISNHYTFLIIFLGIIFLQSYTRYIQTSWVQ
ncbi:MAG: prepilin peptidase [Candidatus Peribacteria bacterium]|nr:MAG: prepilin peptidase [Candidatus Peribacteria bacterium]